MSKPTAREYPEELPVGYYLDNFQRILDFVDDHYDDILAPDEKHLSRAFRSLSLDARRLYVRLISRKGPMFRSDTLRYGEISDIDAAAAELTTEGFLERDEPREPAEELVLLRKAEILELVETCGLDPDRHPPGGALKTLRKVQLVELALSLPVDIRTWIRERFHLYRPLREKEILVAQGHYGIGRHHEDRNGHRDLFRHSALGTDTGLIGEMPRDGVFSCGDALLSLKGSGCLAFTFIIDQIVISGIPAIGRTAIPLRYPCAQMALSLRVSTKLDSNESPFQIPSIN